MARFSFLKNRFNLGEFGKNAFGISNLEEYRLGADTVQNMIPLSSGGVRRREGSRFLTGSAQYRKFFEDSTYGNLESSSDLTGYHRVIGVELSGAPTQSMALLLRPRTDTQDAAFATVYCVWGNTNYSAVKSTASTTVSETTGGTQIVRGFGTGPNAESLKRAKYVQVGDVVFIVAKSTVPSFIGFPSAAITRVGNIYSLPTTEFSTDLEYRVPYTANGDSSLTLDPNNSDGISAGDLNTFIASDSFFISEMEGVTMLRLHGGLGIVDTVNSATSADVRIISTLSANTATDEFEYSPWNDNWGWPTEIAYFESRLFYFRGDTLWASQSGDVTQLSQDVGASLAADSPFSFSFDISSSEEVCWVSSGETLTFGTNKAEYGVVGTDSSKSISATNFSIKKRTTNGSYIGAPSFQVDNALYFFDRDGDSIREYVFDDRENAFRTTNISRLNKGMLRKTIPFREDDAVYDYPDETASSVLNYQLKIPLKVHEAVRQVDGDNIIWMCDNYGGLTSVTIDRQASTYGFAYHKMGGSLDNNDIPKVHSISVARDRLLLCVERTINGSDVTYLEVIPRRFFSDEMEQEFAGTTGFTEFQPVFVDSSKYESNSGSDITTTDELAHLEGETVSIMSDGRFVGTDTVSSSSVTIDRSSKVIWAGLPYESKIKLLPTDFGAVSGTAIGHPTRIEQMSIRFNRTVAASVGLDEGTTGFDDISFRTAAMALQDAIPLFTGLKDVEISYVEEDQQPVIKTETPLPMEITAITLKGQTNE